MYLPYRFELLLRGSRDGFTPEKFHELCDNVHNTVTFIKVKGTEEILGGYNPIVWKSTDIWVYGETSGSFIFSFKFKDNFIKNAIISNVENADHAVIYGNHTGPCFGEFDIEIFTTPDVSDPDSTDYDGIRFTKSDYKKEIKDR